MALGLLTTVVLTLAARFTLHLPGRTAGRIWIRVLDGVKALPAFPATETICPFHEVPTRMKILIKMERIIIRGGGGNVHH